MVGCVQGSFRRIVSRRVWSRPGVCRRHCGGNSTHELPRATSYGRGQMHRGRILYPRERVELRVRRLNLFADDVAWRRRVANLGVVWLVGVPRIRLYG